MSVSCFLRSIASLMLETVNLWLLEIGLVRVQGQQQNDQANSSENQRY